MVSHSAAACRPVILIIRGLVNIEIKCKKRTYLILTQRRERNVKNNLFSQFYVVVIVFYSVIT